MKPAMDQGNGQCTSRSDSKAHAECCRCNQSSEPAYIPLDEEDQAILSAPLKNIILALHFEFLHAIYIRYPDLRPPDPDRDVIDTARRWEEIVLPESVSETDLDSTIFSALRLRWQKTAMVITRALERCETLALPVDAEVVGVRIQALAEAARLESQGATVRCD
jgi:Protein of unknown function